MLFRPLTKLRVVTAVKNILDPTERMRIDKSGFPDSVVLVQISEAEEDQEVAAASTSKKSKAGGASSSSTSAALAVVMAEADDSDDKPQNCEDRYSEVSAGKESDAGCSHSITARYGHNERGEQHASDRGTADGDRFTVRARAFRFG